MAILGFVSLGVITNRLTTSKQQQIFFSLNILFVFSCVVATLSHLVFFAPDFCFRTHDYPTFVVLNHFSSMFLIVSVAIDVMLSQFHDSVGISFKNIKSLVFFFSRNQQSQSLTQKLINQFMTVLNFMQFNCDVTSDFKLQKMSKKKIGIENLSSGNLPFFGW